MFRVATCLVEEHDLWLVGAAALVCVLAWVGALLAFERVGAASPRLRGAWLLLTALSAGGGTWATHFVAMLAYEPGLSLGFNIGLTLVSALIGVGGAWAAWAVFVRFSGPWAPVWAGLLMAAAIGGLHFVGMASVEVAAAQVWDVPLIGASLALVAAFSILAFGVLVQSESMGARAASGVLFVLGVVCLHFTAMGALTLVPDPTLQPTNAFALNDSGLGVAIAIGAAALMLAAGLVSLADRRVAATKLAAAQRMQRLADVAFEGLVIHDRTTIRDANCRIGEMLGYEANDLIGMDLGTFVSAEAQAQLIAAAKGQCDYPVEVTLFGRMAPVDVEVHRRVFNAEEGLYVSAVRDVSLRRRAERAERADAAKSHFIADMNHELRTPLNAILGYAELIAEESRDVEAQEDARRIQTSAQHLLALINEILDISKIEAGRMQVTVEPVNLADIARSVIDTVRPLAAARSNEIGLQMNTKALAMADAFRFKQCLLNLVSNALKFTEAGRVDILISERGESVELSVRDTGIGMDEAQLANVFEPFKQADKSIAHRYGGTGLGLTITRKLMGLMDGDVRAQSAPGQGATFMLVLPRAPVGVEVAA